MSTKNPNHVWLAPILVVATLPIMEEEAQSQTTTFNPNNPAASGYTLVFNSQFSGTSLDTTKWTTGWPWGNGLNTTYPNDEALPANIYFAKGAANFAVTKGTTPSGRSYGSAVATTYGKFSQLYGYWVAQVQFPTNADGIWPAFWLLAEDGSWPPEIDIMEWLGVSPNTDYMTLHYNSNNETIGGTFTSRSISSGYHTLGMLWTPTSVTWYIDGVQEFQATTGIPTTPMYIVLNNDTGGWDNNVVNRRSTRFPAILSVAYVQVYSPPH